MRKTLFLMLTMMSLIANAQNVMTPELLWKLGRITPLGISQDGKNVVYKVSTPSIEENKSNSKYYTVTINSGTVTEIKDTNGILANKTFLLIRNTLFTMKK